MHVQVCHCRQKAPCQQATEEFVRTMLALFWCRLPLKSLCCQELLLALLSSLHRRFYPELQCIMPLSMCQ